MVGFRPALLLIIVLISRNFASEPLEDAELLQTFSVWCRSNIEECIKRLEDVAILNFNIRKAQQTQIGMIRSGIGNCSCGHEKLLVDLGRHYFPRYIMNMTCFQESCSGINKCSPKLFKLLVIRKRRQNEYDEAFIDYYIPSELRPNWVSESIYTTTHCECSP